VTRVFLHGELGKACGEVWNLAVQTPAEALRAIEVNTGKLLTHLRSVGEGLAMYRVLLDDKDHTCIEDITVPIKTYKSIHFIPVPQGAAKEGTWELIAGIALILAVVVVGFVSYGTALGAMTQTVGLASHLITAAFTMGIALTVGGVSMLLTPNPRSADSPEKPDNRPSYIFNGPVNTYRQGNPVPVGYGMLLVGSQVISAGIRATDLPGRYVWNANDIFYKGSEAYYNGRYYRARQTSHGVVPPTYPITENDYWTDVT
jgi:predicted phage tail protein